MKKTAFFTMDVESFGDISCLHNKTCGAYSDFRVEHVIDDYLDLLDKYNIKATFFVLSSSLEHSRQYLMRAVQRGHEIALHGLSHEIPTQMPIEELAQQLAKGKQLLEKEFDTEVIGYRAPCFAVTDEILNAVGKLGFKYDSSYLNSKMRHCPATANLDGFRKLCNGILSKNGLYEISPCTTKTILGSMSISGGGYMRLAPYSMAIRYVKRFLKTSNYYMFYCHPSDIFTEKLPKIQGIPPHKKYFIRAGRKKFLQRIENIIKLLIENGYTFSTMRDFVSSGN